MRINRKAVERAIKSKGLTKTELAWQVGVSRSTIYRWLDNEDFPRIKNVAKLCSVLCVSPKAFIDTHNKWILRRNKNFIVLWLARIGSMFYLF